MQNSKALSISLVSCHAVLSRKHLDDRESMSLANVLIFAFGNFYILKS